jgi:hypothetical protein
MTKSAELIAGEWIEVRSKKEILATLDEQGQFEGLPFMPEMFEQCGKRFRVFKRAHKTCDPPDMIGRQMKGAVHLEGIRCNGAAHGGCQARCLVFWKEIWLKSVDRPDTRHSAAVGGGGCSENDVQAGTRRVGDDGRDESLTYVCQATELRKATRPYSSLNPGTYVEDYSSGNVSLSRILATFTLFFLSQVTTAGIGLGTAVRWTYDRFQRLRGGTPYPWRSGAIPTGRRTPALRLDLQPGEQVRVKSYRQILETLDVNDFNRGMRFDAEMVPYCGGTYRVLDRVRRIINERTGKMLDLRNDCIILDGVTCEACYAKHRRFCSRSIYPYWREIWLERIN